MIQPDDVIITFNYDDSLERELRLRRKWDIARGYGFPLGSINHPTPVLVLKLHGSMNWIGELFGGVTRGPSVVSSNPLGEYPVIHQADLEYLGYAREFAGRTYSGGGVVLTMILPGRNKEFLFRSSFGIEWKSFFDSLWLQAREALGQANRVVICGYSMVAADQRACETILGTPDKSVEVEIISGNQGEHIAARFRDEGFMNVSCDKRGYFEDWVKSKIANQQQVASL